MESQKSAPKHQIDHDYSSGPALKMAKMLDVDDDEHPHAFTRLPPEILLDIFDLLKPDDDCMKKLSEVCKKFYNLCSPRLRVLKLDFKYFNAKKKVIRRAYTEIRMFGEEFDCKREEIGKVLESSAESARKLLIRSSGKQKRAIIKMRTLMFVLQSLPNLEEIEISYVNGLMPQFSKRAIKSSEKPSLKALKKLTLKNVPGVICLAFHEARNIEELELDIRTFKDGKESMAYYDLVVFQKKLKRYHSSVRAPGKIPRYARSQAAFGGHIFEQTFKDFPDLEHIKIHADTTQELLIAGDTAKNVKSIELLNNYQNFQIEQIRKKYPSLESFKTGNVVWRNTKTDPNAS